MNRSVILALAVLVFVMLVWLVLSYKGFRRLNDSVTESFHTTELYLKKRRELIKKLIRGAENSGSFDSELLAQAREWNIQVQAAKEMEEIVACENELTWVLGELFQQADQVSGNFEKRKKQILSAENEIERFARFYNTLVKMLNTRVNALPSSLIAKLFHFTTKPLLDTEIGEKRCN